MPLALKECMDKIPLKVRLFHVWLRLTRSMTLGVRIILQDEDGKVLLVRHGYVKGWHLPGGGVEVGDSAAETVYIELLEETGISCEADPVLFSIYANRKVTKRDHVLLYKVDKWQRAKDFISNWEIKEIGFFALDALPEETTQSTKDRLAEVLNGNPISQIW